MTRQKQLLRLGFGSFAAAIAAGGLAVALAPGLSTGDPPLLDVSSMSVMDQLLFFGAGLALLISIISFIMSLMAANK